MSTVLLINPKYPHNVGGTLRACAAFGIPQLNWSGERVKLYDPTVKKRFRLPREERMRGYNENVSFGPVDLSEQSIQRVFPFVIPVAVEVKNSFESIINFEHPEDAVYVFGPEDSGIGARYLSQCHRHIYIPTHFCLNLAACVNVVLYDRYAKRLRDGQEPIKDLRDMLIQHEIPDHMRDGFEGR